MRERLTLAAAVVVLVVASAAPVTPIREGRALLLVLGLLGLRALHWSDGWRTSVVLVALGLFVWHRQAIGFPVLLALYAAGEAIEMLRRPALVRPFFAALTVLGLVAAAHGVVQRFDLDPLTCALAPDGVSCLEPRHNAVTGFAGEPSSFGGTLALTAPAALAVTGPWWPCAALLLAAGLVAAHTTGPVLAVTLAGTVWAWPRLHRARWFILPAALLVLGLYARFVDLPGVERWPVWRAGATRLLDSPFAGYGLGGWAASKFYETTRHGYWLEAHNEPLQWAYETGYVGVVALGGYLGRLLWRLWHTPDTAVLRAMALIALVTASVHFTAHVATTGVLLILTLAMTEAVTAKEC